MNAGAIISIGAGAAVGVGTRHLFGGGAEMRENSTSENLGWAGGTAAATLGVGSVFAASDADKLKRGLQIAGRHAEAAELSAARGVKELFSLKMGTVQSSTFGLVGMGLGAAATYAAYGLLDGD